MRQNQQTCGRKHSAQTRPKGNLLHHTQCGWKPNLQFLLNTPSPLWQMSMMPWCFSKRFSLHWKGKLVRVDRRLQKTWEWCKCSPSNRKITKARATMVRIKAYFFMRMAQSKPSPKSKTGLVARFEKKLSTDGLHLIWLNLNYLCEEGMWNGFSLGEERKLQKLEEKDVSTKRWQ